MVRIVYEGKVMLLTILLVVTQENWLPIKKIFKLNFTFVYKDLLVYE